MFFYLLQLVADGLFAWNVRQCAEDGVKKARKVWIPLSLVIIFAATKADGGRPGRWIDVNEASVNLPARSEEHTSELQSLMRISYAVFCLKKKKKTTTNKELDKQRKKHVTRH